MSFVALLEAIWAHRKAGIITLAAALLVIVTYVALSPTFADTATATSRHRVTLTEAATDAAFDPTPLSNQSAQGIVAAVSSPSVLSSAASTLKIDWPAEDLPGTVAAQLVSPNTVEISTTAGSPQEAMDLHSAIVTAALAETQQALKVSGLPLKLTDAGDTVIRQDRIRPVMYIFGVLVALLLGLGGAVAAHLLSGRFGGRRGIGDAVRQLLLENEEHESRVAMVEKTPSLEDGARRARNAALGVVTEPMETVVFAHDPSPHSAVSTAFESAFNEVDIATQTIHVGRGEDGQSVPVENQLAKLALAREADPSHPSALLEVESLSSVSAAAPALHSGAVVVLAVSRRTMRTAFRQAVGAALARGAGVVIWHLASDKSA